VHQRSWHTGARRRFRAAPPESKFLSLNCYRIVKSLCPEYVVSTIALQDFPTILIKMGIA